MQEPLSFRTHTGEIVTGERLQAALETVANDWIQLCRDIRAEDAYADHVTEAEKAVYLSEGLAFAETIRAGEVKSFATWQRINTALTGSCVAFLP